MNDLPKKNSSSKSLAVDNHLPLLIMLFYACEPKLPQIRIQMWLLIVCRWAYALVHPIDANYVATSWLPVRVELPHLIVCIICLHCVVSYLANVMQCVSVSRAEKKRQTSHRVLLHYNSASSLLYFASHHRLHVSCIKLIKSTQRLISRCHRSFLQKLHT